MCWCAAVCVRQDVCCVRGAEGRRVLPAEERRQSGWKGHAHHSQARSHVPPPPLGAQRRGPFHWRERQTRARHTQVTTASLLKLSIMHVASLHETHTHTSYLARIPRGGSHLPNTPHTWCTNYMHWLFLFVLQTSYSFSLTLSLPLLSCLVLLLCVPCNVSRDGAAGSVTDDGNRK